MCMRDSARSGTVAFIIRSTWVLEVDRVGDRDPAGQTSCADEVYDSWDK